MAEQQRSRSRIQHRSRSDGSVRRRPERERSDGRGISAPEAVKRVREALPLLLGWPVESVIGVERDADGGWQVTVQVVELERIPRSADVLGAYVVSLDENGELEGYERRRRYARSQLDKDY